MVEKGDLSFREVDCLCGYSDFLKIAEQDRYGLSQRVVVCKKCGFDEQSSFDGRILPVFLFDRYVSHTL